MLHIRQKNEEFQGKKYFNLIEFLNCKDENIKRRSSYFKFKYELNILHDLHK